MTGSQHIYEVRPRKDKRVVALISDVLPFGGLWYTKLDDAVSYAKFFSRSHDAVIRVYDETAPTHRLIGLIRIMLARLRRPQMPDVALGRVSAK